MNPSFSVFGFLRFDLLLKGIPPDSPYFCTFKFYALAFSIDRRLLFTSQGDAERILETFFADICVRKHCHYTHV